MLDHPVVLAGADSSGAGDGNRRRMTSLEDRCRGIRAPQHQRGAGKCQPFDRGWPLSSR